MPAFQLNLVVLRSADIDGAARFYRLLGLEFTRHRHGSGPEHYSCELGAVVFEIYPQQEGVGRTSGARIGFRVDALDRTITELQEAGAEVLSHPRDSPWGRRAVVIDPDGHRVELTEGTVVQGVHQPSGEAPP